MQKRVPLWAILVGISMSLVFVGDKTRLLPLDSLDRDIAAAHREARAGRFEPARTAYLGAAGKSRDLGDRKNQAECLIQAGLMAWNLGKIPDAVNSFEISRKVLDERGGGRRGFCLAALQIIEDYQKAKKLRDAGDLEGALGLFESSVKRTRSIRCLEFEAKCLRQLSICYWQKNELETYFELNKKARDIAHLISNSREEGICLNNMGIYFSFTNNYSKSLESFDQALKFFDIDGTSEDLSNCLSNLAILYMKLSEIDKAISYSQRVLDIDLQARGKRNICIDLNNLGLFYKNKAQSSKSVDDFNIAKFYLFRSLEIAKSIQANELIVKSNNNIGEILFNMDDHEGALSYFKAAQKLLYGSTDFNEICSTYNNIGNCYLSTNECNNAQGYFEYVLINIPKILNSEIIEEALFGLGRCFEMRGNADEALKKYAKCLGIIDHIRGQIQIDVLKSGFSRRKNKIYQTIFNLLVELKKQKPNSEIDEEIFLNIEKAKARSFLESLVESRVDIGGRFSPSLRKEEARISGRMAEISIALLNPYLDSITLKNLRSEYLKEEESYLRLSSQINGVDSTFTSLIMPDICSVQEAQGHLLNEADLLIEYFVGESYSIAAVVAKNQLSVHLLPGREKIANSVKAYMKFVANKDLTRADSSRAAKRIFNELLFPLRDPSFSAKKRLIIIPDGILYSLPFEALMDGELGGQDRFLIERFEISYVPSATILRWLSEYRISGPRSEGLLAFGDPEYIQPKHFEKFPYLAPWDKAVYAEYLSPLPMSREEIQTAAKFFPRRGRRIFLGREAREETFKQMDGHRYSVIHLACHSYIDEDFPLRSALYFSTPESESEDGRLQVRELYNMRLPADLVVLSACQTARGRMDSWEGVLSMPRNFFYMGARSVVSTLWPIEDNSSAFFMDRFYGGLARGLSTAKALQRAKIDMIHMGYAEAHYWAPFILCGDPRSKIDMLH